MGKVPRASPDFGSIFVTVKSRWLATQTFSPSKTRLSGALPTGTAARPAIMETTFASRRYASTRKKTLDELVESFRRGDPKALQQLLEQHGPRVRAAIRIESTWRSVLDADDVMQVAYMEAFLHAHEFRGDSHDGFAAWLMRIAKNAHRDAVRCLSAQKRPSPNDMLHPSDDQDPLDWLCNLLSVSATRPSVVARRGELREHLNSVLEGLPDDYAEVIRRCFLQGEKIPAIAEALHRSKGAVSLIRYRALERMRRLFGPGSRFLSTS